MLARAAHLLPAAATDRLGALVARQVFHTTRIPGVNTLYAIYGRRVLRGRARPFAVTTFDGLRLHALHVPRGLEAPPRLPILCAHGWFESTDRHARRARDLADRGHDVLLFDQRAHGRSAGRCMTLAAHEPLDASAVLDEAQRRGIVGERVIDIGFSLGAATVLRHAALDRRVAGVIAIAPFADQLAAVDAYRRLYAPWMPKRWLLDGFCRAAAEMGVALESCSPREAAARLAVPALVVAGERDRHLSVVEHARPLYEAQTRGECRYFEVAGATHFTLARRRRPELEAAIEEFCAAVSASRDGKSAESAADERG